MTAGITTLTTPPTVRAHSAEWFKTVVGMVLGKATSYSEDNDPEMIIVQVPTRTQNGLELSPNVLGALRVLLRGGIKERELDLEVKELFQSRDDQGLLVVCVTIYT